MLEHLKTSGFTMPDLSRSIGTNDISEAGNANNEGCFLQESDTAEALPTPSLTTTSPSDTLRHKAVESSAFEGTPFINSSDYREDPDTHIHLRDSTVVATRGTLTATSDGYADSVAVSAPTSFESTISGGGADVSLTTCEARVAGVFHEHGCVSSVHGLAGIINPTSRARHKENISKLACKGDNAIAESKARLISNAALQRQRELHMFRQPSSLIDLDGCSGELAKHLLDLHFNRQHNAFLITYRPAVVDSLANGGPWINKLLLNAIYYSSAPYSDWDCLRTSQEDVQIGLDHFYRRFKQLLLDEIDKPSLPSATALLLASATLISQGHSSTGWNLSGMAYRMILDLGCHMALGPNYQSANSDSSSSRLRGDVEQEMRKRLYWGAYATDTTQALYLGRACMFATLEARVPLQMLDTFEEMDPWQPYRDQYPSAQSSPPFDPRPARAISTFTTMARLLQISVRVTDLYGIQSIKLSHEALLDRSRSIEWELENWRGTLPVHLQVDPDDATTPPPHQITPQ